MYQPINSNPACTSYQEVLPEYVRRELANEAVDQIYPELTAHLESCPFCEPLYYHEFRVQGLRKPLAELQQIGDRASVAVVMEQILMASTTSAVAAPPSTWREVALDYGRGWADQVTGAWQQIEIALANFGTQGTMRGALGGMMGEASDEATGEVLSVVPPEANFELHVKVTPDPVDVQLCLLDVAVTLYDRFGDYAGIEVTLLYSGSMQSAITDEIGKVQFTKVPRDDISLLRMVVRL